MCCSSWGLTWGYGIRAAEDGVGRADLALGRGRPEDVLALALHVEDLVRGRREETGAGE